MKYIVCQCKFDGKPTIHFGVTFPDIVTHKDMAKAVERIRVEPAGPFGRWWMWPKAVSAGFVNDEGICIGDSESLKMKPHPEDSMIIKDRRGIGYREREVIERAA